jgi:RNA polymerase sigma-B factor
MDMLGGQDKTLREIETFGDLRTALELLGPREREVIALRFFDEMSQAKIAIKLNISQMHVSRILARTLTHLRSELKDTRD